MSVQNNNSSCKKTPLKTCSWKVTVFYLKMCLLPWFWDLLLWNRCPRWLTVPLLFEFATEGFFYVVHIESTDCWAGDAVKAATKEDNITKSKKSSTLPEPGTTFVFLPRWIQHTNVFSHVHKKILLYLSCDLFVLVPVFFCSLIFCFKEFILCKRLLILSSLKIKKNIYY